jgi:hypothetical protein
LKETDSERQKETDTENKKGKKKDRQRRGETVGQRNRAIDKGNKNVNLILFLRFYLFTVDISRYRSFMRILYILSYCFSFLLQVNLKCTLFKVEDCNTFEQKGKETAIQNVTKG